MKTRNIYYYQIVKFIEKIINNLNILVNEKKAMTDSIAFNLFY